MYDKYILEHTNIDTDSCTWMENDILESLNVPLATTSEDKTSNNFGAMLLDTCKKLGIYIVNGRMDTDKGVGKLTCDNESVVDYISATLFKYIQTIKIEDFNPLFSDKHSVINMNIYLILDQDKISSPVRQELP